MRSVPAPASGRIAGRWPLRHAVEVAWDCGDVETLHHFIRKRKREGVPSRFSI